MSSFEMTNFSGALQLSDLNDYIGPSQACIKPVESAKKGLSGTESQVKFDKDFLYEVTKDGETHALTKTATITLSDCLACSGCVTSAESILVAQQSQQEVLEFIQKQHQLPIDERRPIVISISPQSIASLGAKYDLPLVNVARKITWFCQSYLGASRVLDIAFFRDISLMETVHEFMARYNVHTPKFPQYLPHCDAVSEAPPSINEVTPRRIRGRRGLQSDSDLDFSQHALPMLSSACPGWICYAEKTQQFVLPLISTTKSPQQIAGTLVRHTLGNCYHISVMPCYDKKLEASRSDFYEEQTRTRDIDCVLTTTELDQLFSQASPLLFDQFSEAELDPWFKCDQQANQLIRTPGSTSGSYMDHVLRHVAQQLLGISLDNPENHSSVQINMIRSSDHMEYILKGSDGSVVFRGAQVYGFRNIQNLIRKVKQGSYVIHFVEVMACPSGCINGGGQIKLPSADMLPKDWVNQVQSVYSVSPLIQWADQSHYVPSVYSDIVRDTPGSLNAQKAFHTQYHGVISTSGFSVKW
jgi:iron only hydrogenase large subunit-like protein